MTLASRKIASPVGTLTLVASDAGLVAILWQDDRPGRVRLDPCIGTQAQPDAPGQAIIAEAQRQLDEYFAGQRRQFNLPLDFRGTEFQKSVWTALLAIPFGETRSYGEIARALGKPGASRAVGAANGRNPLSIVAPCHRVIGTNGMMTGFAGGIAAKEYLLSLEKDDLLA